jgi:hypothetical protein
LDSSYSYSYSKRGGLSWLKICKKKYHQDFFTIPRKTLLEELEDEEISQSELKEKSGQPLPRRAQSVAVPDISPLILQSTIDPERPKSTSRIIVPFLRVRLKIRVFLAGSNGSSDFPCKK